jgi:hypothetical protein
MEAETKVYSRFTHPARVNLNKMYKAWKEGGLKGEQVKGTVVLHRLAHYIVCQTN